MLSVKNLINVRYLLQAKQPFCSVLCVKCGENLSKILFQKSHLKLGVQSNTAIKTKSKHFSQVQTLVIAFQNENKYISLKVFAFDLLFGSVGINAKEPM